MIEMFVFLAICVAAAVLLGIALHALRPSWSRRRIMLVSASPVPSMVLAACIYVFVRAATASAEACGVDACDMAMMAATLGLGIAIAGFAVGLIACEYVQRTWWK
jgi:hypothetical protein